jgi:hypothetical protein
MNRGLIAALLALLITATIPNSVFGQAASAPSPTAAGDAYAPLQLYDGSWDAETSGAKESAPMHISNHCTKTGVFFVCEQVINGKSEDLVVFLPTGASGATQHYRTMGLRVNADKPGDWGNLEISGERWIYSSEDTENGAKVYWRTVNVFSGKDKIHFEIQRSAEGKTWETKSSGDERRVK